MAIPNAGAGDNSFAGQGSPIKVAGRFVGPVSSVTLYTAPPPPAFNLQLNASGNSVLILTG